MTWSKTELNSASRWASALVSPASSTCITGMHARATDRDAVPLARGRGADLLARIARERPLRHEAVTERPRALVRENPRLALPAGPVCRVERVDVEIAPVLVLRNALRVRCRSRRSAGRGTCTGRRRPASARVRPVGMDLELRELAGEVREVEFDVRVVREPGIEAEERQPALPRLHRPVRPVSSLACGHEHGRAQARRRAGRRS